MNTRLKIISTIYHILQVYSTSDEQVLIVIPLVVE